MKNLSKFESLKIKNNYIMKKIMTFIVSAIILAPMAFADDKPFDFNKLPAVAKEFITKYFPNDKAIVTTVDDDLVRPDYEVILQSGAKIGFDHGGALEKVDMREGAVPAGIVPEQIMVYLSAHYPDAAIVEYEVGKNDFEVKLTNSLELKFNSAFKLIGIDD